jgi:hypothetical protein
MDYRKKQFTEKTTLFGLIPKREYVFEAMATVNGRYIVIQDSVFDLQEQVTIGNLWDSLDIFKTIFQNTEVDDVEYGEIRESILALPLLEAKQNLHELRDILIEWSFFDDTWVGKQLKNAGTGIANFATQSWEGLKKLGLAISKGDWSQILGLLAKGVKFVLRKLRDALYSNIGMIVDGILIATGIGKGAQMVACGLVLALDVYQFIFNDYPSDEADRPTWKKLLDIGFDALGFISAGGVAKASKLLMKPILDVGVQDTAKVAETVAKNPEMKSTLQKIGDAISNVPQKLASMQTSLTKTFPKGAEFIGSILGKLGSALSGLKNFIIKITGGAGKLGKGIRGGTEAGLINYGYESLFNKPSKYEDENTLKKLFNPVSINSKEPYDPNNFSDDELNLSNSNI